ncbi:hypothetical protein B566_EDAN013151 [Ephemera danica]|nr:hypothetical protein B566_EDAN013151 [Ephemera danica]
MFPLLEMARRENDVPTNSTASPALEQLQIEVKQRSGQTKTFVEEKEAKVQQTPELDLKQVGGGMVDASTQTQTDPDTSTQTDEGTYNWKQIHFTSITLLALCVAPFYLKSNKNNSPGNIISEKEVKVQTPELDLKQVGGGTVDASTQTDVDASTQTDVDASTQTDMDTSTQTAVGTYNWKQVHFTSIALLALCVAPFYLKSNKDNSPGNIVSGLIMYHVLKPFFETFGDKVVKVVEQIYK